MASKTAAKGRAKGTGTITKDGNRFYLRKQENGKRLTVMLRNEDGTPCTTRPQAEEAAERLNKSTLELDTREKMIEQVAEIRQLRQVATTRAADLWDMYLKSPNYRQTSKPMTDMKEKTWSRFCDWLASKGVTMAADITNMLAGEYLADYGDSVSNRTFNGTLTTLRSIIHEVGKNAGLPDNPFDGIKRRTLETVSRREFTAEQVKQIFDGFKNGFFYKTKVSRLGKGRVREEFETIAQYTPLFADEMEVLLLLCCYTGADGECGCLMEWSGVDLEGDSITYIRYKTRKKRRKIITIPKIHADLRKALIRAQTWRIDGNPYILPNVAERYQRNRYGIQKDVQKIIRLALGVETTEKSENTHTQRALGASIYSLHSFRHTFASFAINAGVSMAVIQEILGHGSPIVTKHYSHISDETKAKAIAALPEIEQAEEPKDITDEATRMKCKDMIDALPIEAVREIMEKYGVKAK